MRHPSSLGFDNTAYAWKPDIDYRQHPELYRVGKGEQGVLIVEPYKSELIGLWRFSTPEFAEVSSQAIAQKFHSYLEEGDFVGADMARKFLQMGFTRARRYANYKGGRKYDDANGHAELARGAGDPEKAKCAQIFYLRWQAAETTPFYASMKADWKDRYG